MEPEATTTAAISETEFEKRRGIAKVDLRPGFAQVQVLATADTDQARLQALDAIKAAGVSLDFLKLIPKGMSFLVREEHAGTVEGALKPLGFELSIQGGRTVVMVHAVNMRDEEGLIASIVHKAIASGAQVDHMGDMHDRVLLVASEADAGVIQKALGALS